MDALRTLLADPARRVQRRAAEVLAALAATSEVAGAVIQGELDSSNPAARWGAAFAQAALGCPSLTAAMVWIDGLGSPDSDLRWAAHALIVRHLSSVDGQAVDGLLRAAAGPSDPQRRKMALYCLRDLGLEGGDICRLCAVALDACEIEVRLAALSAYPRVVACRAEAADLVARYVTDPDPRMCRAAAVALGKIGLRTVTGDAVLQAAARSSDAGLRRASAAALQMLGAPHGRRD